MTEQERIAKNNRIETIVNRLMGALYSWEKPEISKTVGPYLPEAFDQYGNSIHLIRQGLFDRLSGLSIDDLNFRFDQNGKIKSELIKNAEEKNFYYLGDIEKLSRRRPSWLAGGFGHPEYTADFNYWGQMSEFTLDEALLLSVGVEPKHISSKNMDLMVKKVGQDQLYPALEYIVKRREQFRRYFPTGMTGWLRIPAFKLKKWFDEISLDVHEDFYAELERLYPSVKIEPTIQTTNELGPSERETLLKLIAAMACEQYAFNINAVRNTATSAIRDDIETVGLTMDNKTILKWLKEASKLVSSEYWKI